MAKKKKKKQPSSPSLMTKAIAEIKARERKQSKEHKEKIAESKFFMGHLKIDKEEVPEESAFFGEEIRKKKREIAVQRAKRGFQKTENVAEKAAAKAIRGVEKFAKKKIVSRRVLKKPQRVTVRLKLPEQKRSEPVSHFKHELEEVRNNLFFS